MKGKVIIWIVVALIISFFILWIYSYKTLKYNWNVNLETDHQPYDVDLLKGILSAELGTNFRETDIPFHRWMEDLEESENSYVFCGWSFDPDSVDALSLLDFVAKGNNAVLSAQNIGYAFNKALETYGNFNLPQLRYRSDTNYVLKHFTGQDTLSYSLNYFGPDKSKYVFPFQYLTSNDSCPEFQNKGFDKSGNLTFFAMAIGDGRLTIHLTPLLLTNYHLKNKNAELFAEKIFEIEKSSKVFWEKRRSVAPISETMTSGQRNPFEYIFSQPSLKWAFLLILIGVLIFLVIASRRRQAAIPVFVHPENTTLRFLENMYELHKLHPNYTNMARFRYLYFMYWLQKNYMIDRSEIRQSGFQSRIESLCKWEKAEVAQFVSNLRLVESNEVFSEIMLYHLSLQLEKFYAGRSIL